MPKPIKTGKRYMPGLDGLRAVAVLGVIGYHLGVGWIPGGLLGVSVFFTLSGYLITDLLLAQVASGGIKLKAFWLARARRLLPALFLMLIIVMAWVTVIGPHQTSDFRAGALSAAAYFNNWWLVFHDVSYFAAFEAPGPINHLWSLSVEEQFYIVWPFVLMLGVKAIREADPASKLRPRLALATLGLALVSFLLMVLLYKPGIDPSRVYYGTDTRAMELLVGAALACVWPSRALSARIKPSARNLIDGAGIVGLLVIGLMYLKTNEFSPFLYRGGFVVLSFSVALVVAALAHPASRLGPALGSQPLRWIGERSYGIYLWHFPVIILTTPASAQGTPGLVRGVLQIAATFGIAALSWKYVENPIRHGALARLWAQFKDGTLARHYRPDTPPRRAAFAAVLAVAFAALAGFAGVGIAEGPAQQVGEVTVATTETADASAPADGKPRVSCKSVVHIGDSTSEGLVSSDYLPPKEQIAAQYAKVGATTAHLEVSGARSIHETFEGQPNAETVAKTWKANGFDGCWVFALGTNEAADVAAGSTFDYNDRIRAMMNVAGDDPVLWVNVKSLVPSGPYAAQNMASWDQALEDACSRYPNMRIYDWASDVKDDWFIDDQIHFTSEGYAARSRLIAKALLHAFPASADGTTSAETTTTTTASTTSTDGSAAGGSSASCLIS